jgi:DNA-binding response OmpR family regulator
MSSAQASHAPTVVIVEDDVALLQALRFMLISEGFETEACETAEALLDLALPAVDVCLVIDERLPGLQGLEALETLRARGVDAPAIVITTNPEDALREAAVRCGAEVVEKPLVGDALLARIRALVNGREP